MKLCPHCEVEVEEDARYCPLCRRPLQPGLEDDKDKEPARPSRGPTEADASIRRWVLELLSLLTLTGALVVFAADFAPDMSLSWARYALASIGFLWLSGVLAVFFSRRAWIYLPAEIAAACLYLFVLDRFTPGPGWFLPLALPLTLLIGVILALTFTIITRAGLSPVGTIAAEMVAAGVFVMGLELLLNSYQGKGWFVSWSAVASVCMLPLLFLLLYLRKWVRARQGQIRKLLHL